MTEHGILFSGPMVRALLAGRKTQTRRAVNPQPPEDDQPGRAGFYCPIVVRRGIETPGPEAFGIVGDAWTLKCPHPPGTRLWVREASAVGDDGRTYYRADGRPPMGALNVQRWTPGIHMPRNRARIFLDVTGVRVERAQSISDADVAAEGVDAEAVRALAATATKKRRTEALSGAMVDTMRPAELWRAAWMLINGAESYTSNPWCWVYEFKRTEAGR